MDCASGIAQPGPRVASSWNSPAWQLKTLSGCGANEDAPLAADESIRRAEDPLGVARLEAADVKP